MQIYFIRKGNSNSFKIGISANPDHRLTQLQYGEQEPLSIYKTIPGNRGLERRLHQHFVGHRINGEWFNISPEEIEAIASDESFCLPRNDNATHQKNFRLKEGSNAQLQRLAQKLNASESEAVTAALDLLYRQTFKEGWLVAYSDESGGDSGYFDTLSHFGWIEQAKVPFETREQAEAAAEKAKKQDDYSYEVVRIG